MFILRPRSFKRTSIFRRMIRELLHFFNCQQFKRKILVSSETVLRNASSFLWTKNKKIQRVNFHNKVLDADSIRVAKRVHTLDGSRISGPDRSPVIISKYEKRDVGLILARDWCQGSKERAFSFASNTYTCFWGGFVKPDRRSIPPLLTRFQPFRHSN